MSSRRVALIVVGVILLLAGTTFALQGDNVIGGSSFMNGDPTWIYAGSALALLGLIIAIAGAVSKTSRMGSGAAQMGPAQ